ncbi:putative glycogen synthase, partial [Toxoplasma gondii MAS]
DRAKYEQLRANARASVVSCEESARAWLGEFARLRKKIPVNEKRVQEIFERLPDWSEAEWRLRRGTAPAFSSFLPSFSSESPVKPPAGTVVASLPRGPIPTSPFPPATLLGLLQFCEDREMHMHAADRAVQLGGRAARKVKAVQTKSGGESSGRVRRTKERKRGDKTETETALRDLRLGRKEKEMQENPQVPGRPMLFSHAESNTYQSQGNPDRGVSLLQVDKRKEESTFSPFFACPVFRS